MLRVAARWHDWGKAHAVFQKAVRRSPQHAGKMIAKAPDGYWDDYERPHFRHELASALGVLATLARKDEEPDGWKRLLDRAGLVDLAVYLIAAHHGKVRLSIRSLPGETKPPVAGAFFARGIWEGDGLPEVDLGGGTTMVTTPKASLDLSPMQLGTTNGQPSWAERMLGVRDQFGPLRVAYLEAILRAADMRASRAANTRKPEAEHA